MNEKKKEYRREKGGKLCEERDGDQLQHPPFFSAGCAKDTGWLD